MADYTKPYDMTDEQLIERYNLAWHKAVGNFQLDTEANLLVTEMNRRQMVKTEKYAQEISRKSLFISGLALTFAALSLIFSLLDWFGDKQWQKDQLFELRALHGELISLKDLQTLDSLAMHPQSVQQ